MSCQDCQQSRDTSCNLVIIGVFAKPKEDEANEAVKDIISKNSLVIWILEADFSDFNAITAAWLSGSTKILSAFRLVENAARRTIVVRQISLHHVPLHVEECTPSQMSAEIIVLNNS
ncbi:hypothetical protein EPUL_001407 [Erysiphe pulchra]|uniref:Uncharacterized protein n=1 Tax=Erysiphe pulchra TaxID=225359 RepID=A0A2S4PYR4_9PEZI|nr:hypothetical protein EPUL_001407 [Erysiphe pulchra]